MNLAESLYIGSRLRTKRLRRTVVPDLVALGGRVDGRRVLDIGCGPGECVACELDDLGAAHVTAIDLERPAWPPRSPCRRWCVRSPRVRFIGWACARSACT